MKITQKKKMLPTTSYEKKDIKLNLFLEKMDPGSITKDVYLYRFKNEQVKIDSFSS